MKRRPARHLLQARTSTRDAIHGYVFLAPFLFAYIMFLLFPFVKGISISLYEWNVLEVLFDPAARRFVGLANYAHILTDVRFWRITANTVLFVAATVPLVTGIGLGLAVALNRPGKLMGALRAAFFISQVLSVAVVTLIWQMMFSPRQGLIAHVLNVGGGEPIFWTTDPAFAMPSLVIVTVWWSVGFALVLFLAGLQEIPDELYEAGRLDGAGRWAAFRFITLPSLRRSTTFVVLYEIVLHFQVFGQSHLITRGGPNDTTQVLVRYVYETAFRDSQLGYASAVSVLLFAIMLVFSVFQLRWTRGGDAS